MAQVAKAPLGPAVSREDLVARARAMAPRLAERAKACEEERRLPEESVKELKDAGLFRLVKPKAFGGYEMHLNTLVDVAFELGRGCASTAWVAGVVGIHDMLVAGFPVEAQEEVWGDGNEDRLVTTGWSAKHTDVRRVDGGYLVSGRWEFSSGCHFGAGVLVRAMVPPSEPRGSPEHRLFLLLRDAGEYLIHDDWRTSGLRGTGSEDIEATEAFVPERRSILYDELSRMDPRDLQGAGAHDGPLYRIPMSTYFAFCLPGSLIGSAQGALDHSIERLKVRTGLFGKKIGEGQAIHVRLAEVSAKIDAARYLVRHAIDEMVDLAERWEMPSLLRRATWRRNCAYSGVLACQAVSTLFHHGGAPGIFDDDPLQRHFRDVTTGATHVGTDFDTHGENYGKVALGLSTDGDILQTSAGIGLSRTPTKST